MPQGIGTENIEKVRLRLADRLISILFDYDELYDVPLQISEKQGYGEREDDTRDDNCSMC
jgi:hypothetical protein